MESNKKGLRKKIIITIISIILGCAVMGPPIFSLFTCSFQLYTEYEIFESGYFQYIVKGESSVIPRKDSPAIAVIVGFTESGLQQTVIDIPIELDGIRVREIGFNGGRHYPDHYVYSENLKKVYIHDNISLIQNFEKGPKGVFENGKKVETDEIGNENQVRVMICSMNEKFGRDNCKLIQVFYYYKEIINEKYSNSILSPANVVFMNNYSNEVNQGYYRLDHIGAGETIPAPPAPTREGYLFEGWYQEAECVNVWDFRKSPEIEVGEEFRLYAKWRVE